MLARSTDLSRSLLRKRLDPLRTSNLWEAIV
jgi:hypothetical protein